MLTLYPVCPRPKETSSRINSKRVSIKTSKCSFEIASQILKIQGSCDSVALTRLQDKVNAIEMKFYKSSQYDQVSNETLIGIAYPDNK